ncbi:DUF4097 family beta strand repeat-containing protein [Luteimonas huabeiensis]|uniref:DUF4097 family beta strand repeat-containing protein n=1 Tax=Luteimonas huabeiensis TaxID=1244513 RepID=UPI00046343F5|nr:DUF4097 family beta strand repeat-containing protein [Luteimonas huabeiensis]
MKTCPNSFHRRLAAAVLLTFGLLCASALQAQTRIDERRPLAAGGRVEVENIAGSVRVRGWDRDEVTVAGTLGSGQRLNVDASRNRVRIQVDYPQGRASSGADLEIRVPKGAELEASTVSADLEIGGIDLRSLRAKTVSGLLHAEGRVGEAALGTVSGDIRSRLATARLDVETVSGDAIAAGGVGGEVQAKTVSGDLSLELGRVERLSAESVSGGLDARVAGLAPGGRIAMESVSGRVGLRLPADVSARLRIETFSGRIDSAAGEVERPRHGPGRSLRTRLGGGDGDVSIESHSGSVRVALAD